jgi:predicted MFS family arabinose efflux permease
LNTTTESRSGRAALMVAHCAGMVDLVALPVWVGTLISGYGLDPQQAGGLATLFLAGAVTSSLAIAPRLHRLRGRTIVPLGFGLAALAFAGVALSRDYAWMAVLHLLAGMSAATALSITHGTIGRSRNPHRLFALVGLALGIFGILFMGAAPRIVAAAGAPLLFVIFAAIMALAACTSAFAFPDAGADGAPLQAGMGRLPRTVWLGAAGVSCMALVQAMVFSFVERIGADRGYGMEAVTGVLIALGFVNLLPAPLAAYLEKRLAPRTVLACGPVVQALLALAMTHSQAFAPYAIAAMFFAAVMIFTHTFAFGLLAGLDPSGRAVAATPAMLMIGAAVGPILGGTVVKTAGYASLGVTAALVAACAVACFLPRRMRAAATQS